MSKIVRLVLLVVFAVGALAGNSLAASADKDWYLALRLGYQPYTIDAEGTVADRNFDVSADLSDIIDNTDTTIFGGEIEFGKDKWFASFAGFYQKSEAKRGNRTNGAKATLRETGLNPMFGYRVHETRLGGKPLVVDAMAGLYYVKVDAEVDIYSPDPPGNLSKDVDVHFLDPMIGARTYYAMTPKFGLAASGQIGGFGVGSDFHTVLAGNLIYNFNDWFAASAGYKYWHWEYEDKDKTFSKLKQTLYGPVVGLQFKY